MRDKRRKSTTPGSEPPAPEASEPLAASSIARLKASSQAAYELGKTRQAAVLDFLVEAVAYPSVIMQLMTPFMGWLRWVLLVMLLLPTPVLAADFWTEDWETYSINGNAIHDECFANTNWNLVVANPFGNPFLVSSALRGDGQIVFSGSQACQGHYNHLQTAQGGNADFADRLFGQEVGEVYVRMMHRLYGTGGPQSQFQYSNESNKRFQLRNSTTQANCPFAPNCENYYANVWLEIPATGIQFQMQGSQIVPHATMDVNRPSNIIPGADPSHWYCIEAHVKAGTPGNHDGIVEAWVDSLLVLRFTDVNFVAPGQDPNQFFSAMRLWVQLGLGEGFYDLITVGTTRIGCPGGGGRPPNAPTSLRVQ